jgi:hypothetical protein
MPLPEIKWRRLSNTPADPTLLLIEGDGGQIVLRETEHGTLLIQVEDGCDQPLADVSLDREEAGRIYSWLGRLLDA